MSGGRGGVGLVELMAAKMPQAKQLLEVAVGTHGKAWVQQCVAKSMAGSPGWFWAAEGAMTLGTPTPAQAVEWHDEQRAKGVAVVQVASPLGV